jgi:GH24 family phage-related lysozyme (muramidase)
LVVKNNLKTTVFLKSSKFVFLLLFLLSAPQSTQSVIETQNMIISEKIQNFNSNQKWLVQYEKVVAYIKEHEGFAPVKYICAAGMPTIGYGHVIQPFELLPTVINKKQAEFLVINDFNKALKFTEQLIPDLKGGKKLAVAHFIFALGVGRFNRSELKKAIICNNKNIDSLWLSYSNYKKESGKVIKSDYALQIRKWELELYNLTDK